MLKTVLKLINIPNHFLFHLPAFCLTKYYFKEDFVLKDKLIVFKNGKYLT